MDAYRNAAEAASAAAMLKFSTSFSMASRLFTPDIRQAICNIYGLVRIADEIVDTYQGRDQLDLLNGLEAETYAALERGYSVDLIVHAFMVTARQYKIDRSLIEPFFSSMRTDSRNDYTAAQYEQYIYGSAEVVGLMCLRVFVGGNDQRYAPLKAGARALGSAFQKVNFLRDIRADHDELGRYYFPVGTYETFDDATKKLIIDDINQDFLAARIAIDQLPANSRRAVLAAYRYYRALLTMLGQAPAETVKTTRLSVPAYRKLSLLLSTRFSG